MKFTADTYGVVNFNSIKVQLEHKKAGYEDITLNKFQFHKGTIRTSRV